jgi:three-Cys-motif partner protein
MRKRTPFQLPLHPDLHPHLAVERGPKGEGVGWWVPQVKHMHLCQYIDGTRKAQVKFPKRVLIDPFSGPGRVAVRGESITREGGATAAWYQSVASECPFTDVFVGDIEAPRVDACETRLRAAGAPVEPFRGAAAQTTPLMVRAVPKGALCLAYIDPYNLEHLSFSILQALATLPYIDLAVHFSLMDLSRNVDMELDPARDRFADALPGWRDRAPHEEASKASLASWFFEEWCKQVCKLGFTASRAMPLVDDGHGRVLYRLVFFSRHPLPERIWADIARSPNLTLGF